MVLPKDPPYNVCTVDLYFYGKEGTHLNRRYLTAVTPLPDHVLQVDFVSGSRLLLDMKPYRSWFDEVGSLHVAELGTFTQITGDAPGENIGDIDFEAMAGTWYLDAEWEARSILVFDENGSWELMERPGGDGDPTTVDCGTVELAPEDAEEMYLAVSDLYDDAAYEFTLLDHDTLRWGDFEFYQKMA